MHRELQETLERIELAIDIINDIEGRECLTDDDYYETIEPSRENMYKLKRTLETKLERLETDIYTVKETKEDYMRKIAVGY
ncbi:hypothetical protein CLPU_10c01540 [Gottschalkia purinilytica]|uniref:Uncharacterized protein n=1 Tax=Gottschalkia purinilytica TaxID=1503 RepID=A0A0L0W980_GOTPU|nr:hypothetical protein [Gottschalkia purinilytica]KNF08099.1 hypothetical protein CLPU_10c01540 [Gottschalkia purinilytica]